VVGCINGVEGAVLGGLCFTEGTKGDREARAANRHKFYGIRGAAFTVYFDKFVPHS